MPIITTATVKSILNISVSTWDAVIGVLIPYVQSDVFEHCTPKAFKDKNIYISAITLAFVEGGGSADTITDSDSGFVDAKFEDGMDIYVEDSLYNDGLYNIDTVAAGTLTLDSADDVVAETAGEGITITRIKWPKGLSLWVAQLIWENINRAQSKDVKSERIGDYAVTYQDLSGGGYSKNIMAGINKYRRPKVV